MTPTNYKKKFADAKDNKISLIRQIALLCVVDRRAANRAGSVP
jgi:hypothetical protein